MKRTGHRTGRCSGLAGGLIDPGADVQRVGLVRTRKGGGDEKGQKYVLHCELPQEGSRTAMDSCPDRDSYSLEVPTENDSPNSTHLALLAPYLELVR
jgi:hypothetical protein